MENHRHCKNCGFVISPSSLYCPKCDIVMKQKPKKQLEQKSTISSDLENAIDGYIRKYKPKSDV